MAGNSSKLEDSPVLSYSMALREGKHIVGLLKEMMTTPLADTQQPSLVDLSLSSTPGSAGDGPRRNLFQSPAVENKGTLCLGSLLDTTNSKPATAPPSSGSATSLTEAMNELNLRGVSNRGPEAVPNPLVSSATADSAPSSQIEAGHRDNYIEGGVHLDGTLFDTNKRPLLESQGDGAVPTAPTFALTPEEDKMPLIFFTPVGVGKTTRGCLAQSDSEVVLPGRMGDEDCPAVRSSDTASDRRLSFTVVRAADPVEVEEASGAAPALLSNGSPPFTAADKCELAAAEFPDPSALCDSGDSHAHSFEAGGDDSFLTAYDSPVHPSRRSFVISRDESLVLIGGPDACNQDTLSNASDGAWAPDLPTAVYDSPVNPSRRSFVISRDESLVLNGGPDACNQDTLSNESDGASAPDLPAAAVVAEATFALPAPPCKPASRPQASKVQAPSSGEADTTVVVARTLAPRKSVSRPTGSSLATRKSLLPPPAPSQRSGRVSTLMKPRVPLSRPGGASNAAEETFAVDSTQMPPPASVPKMAPPQQPKKQEQASVRPKLPVPRGPTPSAAASLASRQSMPAPGGAISAVRQIPAGRRSIATKMTAPPASSVPARPRLPPPSTAAGARNAAVGLLRPPGPTGRGGASKVQASLPKPPQANRKLEPQPPAEPQTQKAQLPRSRIMAPKTRVAGGGFSRLPTKAGSSAGNRAALLAPVLESPVPARLSSTPVRSGLPPLDNAVGPELTPIRRQ